MADVKSLLKEARKLIDEGNYKEATECCKSILRKDKQNYLGLVLLGKSLQDSDQAPLAYHKAIATKPDHPLAWQGLASYYERKDGESKGKLFSIYNEILKLQIDEEKSIETITKLGQLGCLLQNNVAITSLIQYISDKPCEKISTIAEKQLLELIKADIPCKEEDIPRVKEIISNLKNYGIDNSLYILVGKVTLYKKDFVNAVEEIIKLDIFHKCVMFREWLCRHLCINFVHTQSFSGFDCEKYYTNITAGIENSKYPGLLKCMILFDKGLYLDAYKMCVPLVNFHEADVTEATFVIKCTMMLKKWAITQKLASNFLMKSKNQDFIIELRKFLFVSLTELHKWKQAIHIANDIPPNSLSISEQAALARCYIELNENVDNVLKNVESTDYHIQLQVLTLEKKEKYSDIINLLKPCVENSSNLFSIGKAYWELEQHDKSLVYLLKAAKLDAEHANTFYYLGKYYYQIKGDYDKAKKCYEKAYSLDNCSSDIIKNLSSVYIKLNLIEADFELLTKAAQNLEDNISWVNYRLGLHYLKKREWENAIIRFRDVIKHNHNDATTFECLADAYYSRGSYTSALKAYNKVMMLDHNKSAHCLTKIGFIHSLLTQYEEALSTFKRVLAIDSGSIIAFKGIAETWIRIAKKKFANKLYGSARDAAQNAINYLTDALTKEKKLLCFWNLLADILVFITKLPNKYSYGYVRNIITDDCQEIGKKETLEIFPIAIACYSLIAKQKQQVESYDLAKTYLDYYLISNKLAHCHISYRLTIACIKKKPTQWRSWNLLGKICIYLKKYSLAQHCFIKALVTTRKWSVAKIWCNLGTLYVKLEQYKLANYCYWRGQSTLPSYAQSWIGQALIAEAIREEEAMDLFRHASRLGYHPESTLGYADWVCRTLKNNKNLENKYVIDGLHAIPYAMDLINWFLSFEPNNVFANNVLGILQERSGLIQSALGSYERALKFVEDGEKNIVLLNTGRIYLRLERYNDAIKTYKAITEGSLNSACGLALALWKKCEYEEAYSVYDAAFHWLCNDDEEKSDILVAMAGIYYSFKGVDSAKILLFRSIQVSQKNPTAHSLFAICSFGITHADQSLSKLALTELAKYEKEKCFGFDIGFLKSFLVFSEDLRLAVKTISDSIHEHPNNAPLWYCMAQYCLNSKETNKIASCCAQRALCSENFDEYKIHPAKMLATAGIAEHSDGKNVQALMLAKKGIHMYPLQSDVWALLIFSMSNKKMKENKNWLLKATSFMRKQIKISRNISRWINLIEKKLTKQLS